MASGTDRYSNVAVGGSCSTTPHRKNADFHHSRAPGKSDKTVALSLKESVLVFACNVRHVRRLAAVLRERGVNAAAVVGETSAGLRRQRVDEFRSGALRVLVSVDLFNTGFDVPKVGALIMARPTFSTVRYMRMLGRGLRCVANGGEPECVVVDLTDNFGRFGDKVVHYDTMRNFRRIQR